MTRSLGLLVLAAAALAQERPPSDVQILKWQVEARARERSFARIEMLSVDHQQPPACRHPAGPNLDEWNVSVDEAQALVGWLNDRRSLVLSRLLLLADQGVRDRHVVAAIRAQSAGSGALLHVLILAPTDLLAAAGATIADLSTNATHVGVKIGTAKHEIGRSTADLSAVLQQSDMVCVSVPSGLLQAILNSFCA